MRFIAPARGEVDAAVFERPPLADWREFEPLLGGAEWPSVAAIDALRAAAPGSAGIPRFVAQTPALLSDGLHYEQRIVERAEVATRAENWHDLFNALIWLRHPALKAALNRRQVDEIAKIGTKARTRAQCALTHFDEAGVVVALTDPALLALWDAHDWHGLFWRERAAWSDGRVEIIVFGHALLEHALWPSQLLVGKALVVAAYDAAADRAAAAIEARALLNDPQELRPLPLSGIPGWHADNARETFYFEAPCFRARREGRSYPPPLRPAPGGEIQGVASRSNDAALSP
jgi:hypothetical protein